METTAPVAEASEQNAPAAPTPAEVAPQDEIFTSRPLPGLEIVGRGVMIRPGLPYELKPAVVKQNEKEGRPFHSVDTGRIYHVPDNYAVNQSPPMSANAALGQTNIYESFDHLKESMSLDAKAMVSGAPFSVDMSMSQVKSTETTQERFYAVRQNFIPLWEVYLPDVYNLDLNHLDLDFPVPFDRTRKEKYRIFFERYGTHVAKRVWVGGKATLTLAISKDANVTQNDIRMGVSVKSATASGSVDVAQNEQRDKLVSNSDITVSGEGGDKLKLGALRSLDDTSFDQWLMTVCNNPKVIEMEVVGIWSLLKDKATAEALSAAYRASVNFRPISLITSFKEDLLLVYGNRGLLFDREKNEVIRTAYVSELIPGLPEEFTTVDLILDYGQVYGDIPDREGKIFLFHDRLFASYDKATGRVDEGYPKLIAGVDKNGKPFWPGLTFDRLDAAINWGDGTAYFFSGPQYIRYNLEKNEADPGYPRPIQPNWSGLTFEYIDAVVTWNNQKAFFFKGNEYIRFNMVRYQADPGYPKTLSSGYIEDWQLE